MVTRTSCARPAGTAVLQYCSVTRSAISPSTTKSTFVNGIADILCKSTRQNTGGDPALTHWRCKAQSLAFSCCCHSTWSPFFVVLRVLCSNTQDHKWASSHMTVADVHQHMQVWQRFSEAHAQKYRNVCENTCTNDDTEPGLTDEYSCCDTGIRGTGT